MNKLIFSFLFLISLQAPAEDATEEKQAPAKLTPEQKATKDLMDIEKQVGALAAKIKGKSDSVELLLRQKAVENDPQKLAEIVKLVQQEHRDLDQLTREYNAQVGILKYRYPERGVTQGRRYQRLNTRSLAEMEKTLGLDAHLKKSRDKVKMVYGIEEKPIQKKDSKDAQDPKTDESILNPSMLSK